MHLGEFFSRNKLAVGFVLLNILLSIFLWNDNDIRNPEGFSDFNIIKYPNYFLGLPAISIFQQIYPFIMKLSGITFYYGQSTYWNDLYLFITIFVVLSIYWFLIGWIIGKIHKRGKSKK